MKMKPDLQNIILTCLTVMVIVIFIMTINYCSGANVHKLVDHYSRKWGVDKRVVMSLIEIESGGNQKAVSKANAVGYMQVTSIVGIEYYKWRYKKEKKKWMQLYIHAPDKLLIEYLAIPDVNICIGTWYLKQCLIENKGNYIKALNAYIMGIESKKYALDYVYKIIDGVVNFE